MGFAIADIFSGGPPDYASQAAQQEQQRQQAITQGTQNINNAFAGFTPDFYNKRRQAYIDYATPQFADQYNYTKNQIGFGLANKGLDKSTAARKSWNDLAKQTAIGQQNIADTATSQSNQLQQSVAQSKDNLLNMLYQSADPAGAASAATSTAASFQLPSTFAPIANQFSGLINQYALASLLNQRQVTGGGTQVSGVGSTFAPLPSPSSSSGGY